MLFNAVQQYTKFLQHLQLHIRRGILHHIVQQAGGARPDGIRPITAGQPLRLIRHRQRMGQPLRRQAFFQNIHKLFFLRNQDRMPSLLI